MPEPPLARTVGANRFPGGVLGPKDPNPVIWLRPEATSQILLVCDHAGNDVPSTMNLGVSQQDLGRHIGYDIGAWGVATRLSKALGAELIGQRYSRLVIDCNRPPHQPDAMPARSDGTTVPANTAPAPADVAARVAEIFHPYHAAIAASLDRRADHRQATVLVAVHSFTPHHGELPGPRPWPVALLYRDPTLSLALNRLLTDEGLLVGMNEPYSVDDVSDYTIPVQAEARGLQSVTLELRQDKIGDADGQAEWAERLARLLPRAVSELETEPS